MNRAPRGTFAMSEDFLKLNPLELSVIQGVIEIYYEYLNVMKSLLQ